MPKTTTIDPGVLEMALVGYEMQRNRIEAAIAEIQAELGQDGMLHKDTRPAPATATTTDEPKTKRKRFSAAARKRMAAAQKKRWQLKRATAKTTQPAMLPPGGRQFPIQPQQTHCIHPGVRSKPSASAGLKRQSLQRPPLSRREQ